MKRIVTWALGNGSFALFLWLWLVEGIRGAHSVAVFYIWATFCISLFMLSAKVRESLAGTVKVARWFVWFDALFDVAVILALVWNGEILLGSLYLVHALLLSSRYASRATVKTEHA